MSRKKPSVEVVFRPLSPAQERIQERWRESDILFLLGPAGSGKTHAAIALALQDVAAGKAERVWLTRPLVGCGEEIGWLPGGIEEKLGPWMGSVADVLPSMTVSSLAEMPIDLVPLGTMRGRTVRRAVAILDEAQNVTLPQMRMVLSRIGQGGKLVICGDPEQSDLPPEKRCLRRVAKAVHQLAGVGVVVAPEGQLVRHPLISFVLDALKQLS